MAAQSTARALSFPDEVRLVDPGLGTVIQRFSFLIARAVFESDSEMALIFGVDRSNMKRWKSGAPLSRANAARLQAFNTVVSLLIGFLEPPTIPKWLRGTNTHLANRRPIDVLMRGRLSEVVAAIENERSGAFS
ncbi:MAG TPA: hypothetical protein VM939_00605 [Gemmatimonadaceae bacterium]|nr:hypothetical protein [Gemmatimonadaceae bacterium]